jgi:LPXTG-site transpeptidase (sortase) family protein
MKASAPILLGSVVGALVAVALVGGSASGSTPPAPVTQQATPGPELHPEPRLHPEHELHPQPTPKPDRTSPLPARVAGSPLLNIPRLDLKARIGADLNRGPAWWPVTGRPGGGDTVAIAGHRTTYTRPFYWLERLRPGDAIYVRWAGRMHAYRVTGRRILSAKQMHIADARGYEVLLLSACTPRGSARQRIVVYARPRV